MFFSLSSKKKYLFFFKITQYSKLFKRYNFLIMNNLCLLISLELVNLVFGVYLEGV